MTCIDIFSLTEAVSPAFLHDLDSFLGFILLILGTFCGTFSLISCQTRQKQMFSVSVGGLMFFLLLTMIALSPLLLDLQLVFFLLHFFYLLPPLLFVHLKILLYLSLFLIVSIFFLFLLLLLLLFYFF